MGYHRCPNALGLLGIPVRELDDVGTAYDLVQERNLPLQQTLGRHSEDPVISFYHYSPAGFTIEYFHEIGHWNENAEMNPERVSLWGHKFVGPAFPTTVRPL